MAHVTFLVERNCLLSSAIGTMDALSVANVGWRRLNGTDIEQDPLFVSEIVTPDGESVEGWGPVSIQPHKSMYDVEHTDFVMVPGFLDPISAVDSVSAEVVEWIKYWYNRGALIGTTCTGTFLLAETGLLDGRLATTHWRFAGVFRQRYSLVRLRPDRLLTEDGGLICTGGTGSYLKLCVHLIRKFGSEELAHYCTKVLLVDPNWETQAPYFIIEFCRDHGDETVLEAQNRMETDLADNTSVDKLASDLGVSPRHFKRRFKQATGHTPLTYLHLLRVEVAKQKLEATRETVDEITCQVGYQDSNSFRRLFRKYTGLSPREYRSRFNFSRTIYATRA
jgi:transcriptional regulator GlxA family with amidase domain